MLKQTGLVWFVMALALLAATVVLWSGMGPAPTVEAQADRIIVAPLGLTLSEPSDTGIFTITLTSTPTASVTIPLSTSNGQCAVAVDQVVLDPTNWDTGVPVAVSAVDDAIVDGTQICVVETAAASSADPNYDSVNPDDVTVSVLDDDMACIIVSPTILNVSEPDGCASFTIRLCSQPTSVVYVPLSTSNTQCLVSTHLVFLTASTWSTGVSVVVCAVDDPYLDGAATCTVQAGPTASDDPNYNNLGDPGVDPVVVIVIVQDDDSVARTYVPLVARNWMPGPPESPIGPIQSGVTYKALAGRR
jgi:hypothetical protein